MSAITRPRLLRDELKKIDEQTGGQKGKGNNRPLSAEEKQIQVQYFEISLFFVNLNFPDFERKGGATA